MHTQTYNLAVYLQKLIVYVRKIFCKIYQNLPAMLSKDFTVYVAYSNSSRNFFLQAQVAVAKWISP